MKLKYEKPVFSVDIVCTSQMLAVSGRTRSQSTFYDDLEGASINAYDRTNPHKIQDKEAGDIVIL